MGPHLPIRATHGPHKVDSMTRWRPTGSQCRNPPRIPRAPIGWHRCLSQRESGNMSLDSSRRARRAEGKPDPCGTVEVRKAPVSVNSAAATASGSGSGPTISPCSPTDCMWDTRTRSRTWLGCPARASLMTSTEQTGQPSYVFPGPQSSNPAILFFPFPTSYCRNIHVGTNRTLQSERFELPGKTRLAK